MYQPFTYKPLVKVAKIIFLLLVSAFIIYKLFFAFKINTLFKNYDLIENLGSWYCIVLVFVFMLLNWGLESIKWMRLIARFEDISFLTAVKAVVSGITFNIITPNQMGDFAGRVIHLQTMNKWRGSLVTVIGHFAQIIVTLFFGLCAFAYFGERYLNITLWLPIGIVAIMLLLYVYFHLHRMYQLIKHLPFIHKIEMYVNVFDRFSSRQLWQILLISFARYLVYVSQYYLLLQFFKVDIEFVPTIACIIGTFCVQSVVPSFLLLEIGVRGLSALAFFTLFSVNQEGILLATYSLWMINILLPALLGMYFIYKVKS